MLFFIKTLFLLPLFQLILQIHLFLLKLKLLPFPQLVLTPISVPEITFIDSNDASSPPSFVDPNSVGTTSFP